MSSGQWDELTVTPILTIRVPKPVLSVYELSRQ